MSRDTERYDGLTWQEFLLQEVIGDDLVVGGVAYDPRRYVQDGYGGVELREGYTYNANGYPVLCVPPQSTSADDQEDHGAQR